MQKEFDEHEACLGRLQQQIGIYQQQGKEQAASRLDDQVAHVQVRKRFFFSVATIDVIS